MANVLESHDVQMILGDLRQTIEDAAKRLHIQVNSVILILIDSDHSATAAINGCSCPTCAAALVTAAAGVLQASVEIHIKGSAKPQRKV
jgi:hypothetical protein